MNTLLSIIIPVYNAEKYIRETILSVLAQNIQEIEVICVDDGSTDNSKKIIEEIVKNDRRVIFLQQENKHAGVARNTGLQIAKGQYVHFLDADDTVLSFAYEPVLSKAIRYDLDMIKFSSIAFDLHKNVTVYKEYYENDTLRYEDLDTVLDGLDARNIDLCVTPWSGIYKRSFLQDNGIVFNDLFCVNDRSFYKAVLMKAKRVMITKDRVVIHKVNVSSSLVDSRTKHFICHAQSIRIIDDLIKKHDIDIEKTNLIIDNEFDDLMIWFGSSLNHSEYRKEVINITGNLLKEYKKKYPFLAKYLRLYYAKIFRNTVKRLLDYKRKEVDESYRYFFDACRDPYIHVLIPIDELREKLSTVLAFLSKCRDERVSFCCLAENITQEQNAVLRQFSEIDQRIVFYRQSLNSYKNKYKEKQFLLEYQPSDRKCTMLSSINDTIIDTRQMQETLHFLMSDFIR